MLRYFKKWFAGIAIVFAVLLGSLTLFAQNQSNKYHNMNRTYDSSWWNYNVPNQYQMQPDQIQEMNDLRLEYDKEIIPLKNELRALRIEMRGYMNRSDFDPDQVKDYRNQIRDIEDQIAVYRLDYRKNMNNLLTDDQKTYFSNSSNGWWDGFYDRCGWDYSEMEYRMGNRGHMDYDNRDRGRMYNNGRCSW
jgi:Spy/CpxP family protein refolding chaperone